MDNFIIPECTPSFLKVRDPSIIAWNRNYVEPKIRINLLSELEQSYTDSSKSEVEDTSHLKVYLRIKPSKDLSDLYDIYNNSLICKISNESTLQNSLKENNVRKQYKFSKIYGPEVNQSYLFNDSVKKSVLNFINGQNSTLLSYGTSGSGKTYTMLGTANEPGMIPRSLEYIFRSIGMVTKVPKIKPTSPSSVIYLSETEVKSEVNIRNVLLNLCHAQSGKNTQEHMYRLMQERLSSEIVAEIENKSEVLMDVWISFAEIYNEQLFDLLIVDKARRKQCPKLSLCMDSTGHTYIKDLTNVHICSGMQAYQLLQYGMQQLNYASTAVNSHSSRSHCIFTVKLLQATPDQKQIQISHFNFCDLAGSERVKNTFNVGDRLKESNNINTSLLVLGRCVKSIREHQKNKDSNFIPFRESKLTRLFQSALSGNESMSIIINMNGKRSMFDENLHVLNFSSTAQEVLINPTLKATVVDNKVFKNIGNDFNKSNSELNENEMLREQVDFLTREIDDLKKILEEQAGKIRSELAENFQKHYTEVVASWEAEVENCRRILTQNHEQRYKELKMYYESQLNRGVKRPCVIDLDNSHEMQNVKRPCTINLDSSAEEEENEKQHYKNDVPSTQPSSAEKHNVKEIAELKMKLKQSEELLLKFQIENEKLKNDLKGYKELDI